MSIENALAQALAPVIRQVVSDEIARAFLAHDKRLVSSEVLSATKAAKRASVRVADLLAALAAGEVNGAKFRPGGRGGRGRCRP